MEIKIFETHTLAVVKNAKAIENSCNVWLSEHPEVRISDMRYFVNQRVNKNGTKYEEMTLIVLYDLKAI